jgi:hypothetical protein
MRGMGGIEDRRVERPAGPNMTGSQCSGGSAITA